MLRSRSLRLQLCTFVVDLVLGASGAVADPLAAPEIPFDQAQPFDFSTPLPSATNPPKPADVSKFLPKTPKIEWSAKAGVDNRPVLPDAELRPDHFIPGSPQQPTEGVAWANITAPSSVLMDKASLETRLDPEQASKLGLTMSRSLAIGKAFAVTWQNSYSVTYPFAQTAATPVASRSIVTTATFGTATTTPSGVEVFDTNQSLRFTIKPVDTTFSVAAAFSNTDAKWLRSMRAEQKLFGGPFDITGTVQETPTGGFAKSIEAEFKKSW
jgi:hypothetical protein